MLPAHPDGCPACGLPLSDPLTHELFPTLAYADDLIDRLRATVSADPRTELVATLLGPATPRSAPARDARRGVRTASVPTILLGLGALCLLVAAVTFLAVAWSWMGVGGRTSVLLGLTAAAGGVGLWLGRRGLGIAAESLTTVALGLVTLDVVGAVAAGWLGDPDTSHTLLLLGAGVAGAAAAMFAVPVRLVAPQVGVPLGLCLAFAGTLGTADHDRLVVIGAVLTLAGVGRLGHGIHATTLTWVSGAGVAAWWVWLALTGLADAVADPTLRALWIEGDGLGLVAATLLLLLPVWPASTRPVVARPCLAGAGVLLSVTVSLPALDEGPTAVGVTALAGLLVWTAVTTAAPSRWTVVAAVPLSLMALPAVAIVGDLVVEAVSRLDAVGEPFTRNAGVRLTIADRVVHPALLVPLVGALLLATRVVLDRAARAPWPLLAGTALALAGTATLASYAVPLASVVGALAVVALGLAVVIARTESHLEVIATSALVAAGAVAFALPSDWLTAVGAVAVIGVASVLLTSIGTEARLAGDVMLALALAALAWCVGEIVNLDVALRGLPVLAGVGALAIARPRAAVEASAAVAALVATLGSVGAAADLATSLALHLTVAGAVVTLSSLVHVDRRRLAWPGGLLLAAATWVRLADLGVQAPEAYTLPTAVVLVLVGLRRLYLDPTSSTTQALLPGLALATVPSLLWVMTADPVTLRAALLGAGCLALVLAGTRLGWSSPLVVGAVVGGLLVLRELAPYAAETPQWMLIGLAGTLLTVVGVTWERRLVELRQATTFLGRLR